MMKILLVTLLCLLSVVSATDEKLIVSSGIEDEFDSRIVNGDKAELYSHPYQASLQLYSGGSWHHICGAVIITSRRLLTAAHCVDGKSSSSMRVQVGALNLYSNPTPYLQTIYLSGYKKHESYSSGGNHPNDIAILYLSSSMTYNNNVQPAAIASKGSSFAATSCVISGWGRTTGTGSGAAHLKEVHMTKLSQYDCRRYWGNYINNGHICIFEVEGPSGQRPSACMGDSGGPMMCGNKYHILAGIASWVASGCNGDLPNVYTRVSEYVDWIQYNV